MNSWKRLKIVVTKYILDKYFYKWLWQQSKGTELFSYNLRQIFTANISVILLEIVLLIVKYPNFENTKQVLFGMFFHIIAIILTWHNLYYAYENAKKRNWDILKR